jgi:hypothetical protein
LPLQGIAWMPRAPTAKRGLKSTRLYAVCMLFVVVCISFVLGFNPFRAI